MGQHIERYAAAPSAALEEANLVGDGFTHLSGASS
jgi:hypothetical protein